ncbi:hypothetical protein AeNC1_012053 [Aphanomyces euteiches]|nr:hypothetical protein AeNC1_012053 [Aphanomyces euteiches]
MAHPSEAPYISDDITAHSATKRKFTIHLGLIVLLLINVIVLYVLHFADNSSNVKVKSESFQANGEIDNKVVSFNADGSVRAGAGTTAYLDAATLPSDDLSYMTISPIGLSTSNTAIITYYVKSKKQAVVTTLAVAKDNSAKLADAPAENIVANVQVRGVATLSNTQAVFIESTSLGVVNAVYGKISGGNSVSYVKDNRALIANASISNTIGRVSATQFATTSYEPYVENGTWWQNINVGTVSAEGAITLSSPLRFGVANDGNGNSCTNSKAQVVAGGFLVTYFGTSSGNSTGLCVVYATPNGTAVSKITETCNKKYKPTYFVDSTTLADDLVAFTFYDAANNNALTIATVGVTSQKALVFRSDYVIQGAAGAFDFGSYYSWSPTPYIEALGNNKLAILFLNPSNQGRPTTQVFKVTDSFGLVPSTPLMRLSNGDFSLAIKNPNATTASVTLDLLPVTNSSYAAVYSGALDTLQVKRVSVVESLGKPIGIGSSSQAIVMNGAAKVDGVDLTPGQAYYTTTKGEILAATSTDAGAEYYFVGNKTVVSQDSRVGVAVTKDKIYVTSSL